MASRTSELRTCRRFAWACGCSIFLCSVVFAWLVSGESLNFFHSTPFSDFYDVQARALLAGHWNMPPSALFVEGIRTAGRTYMYYGPVPALLRMPILLMTRRLDGRLTSLSLLLAFIVALIFVSRLSWKIRYLIRGNSEVSRREALLAGTWTAVIGLGSVLLFLGSNIQVYNEAELWGAALSLGAYDAIVGFLIRPGWRRIAEAGLFTVLAIMTRGSVGIGPVVTLGLLALGHGTLSLARRLRSEAGPTQWGWGPRLKEFIKARRSWDWLGVRPDGVEKTHFFGLAIAALVPLACYATVNEIKFRSLFSLPLNRQYMEADNPIRQAVLASNHGSLFSYKYIPTSLLAYLRPDALRFTRLFPFEAFPGPATIVGHVLYDTRDAYSSISSSMPVLFVTGLVGLVAVFWPGRGGAHWRGGRRDPSADAPPSLSVLRLVVVGAAVGTYGVLSIAYIAERYLADFVPSVVVLAVVGFHVVVPRLGSVRRWIRATAYSAAAVLALFGVWTNIGLGLIFQRELAPNIPVTSRAQLVSVQAWVNSALFGGSPAPVLRVSTLPRIVPTGSLAIVGACKGLYQFDGYIWHEIEVGPRDGAVGLAMTFRPTRRSLRQPVAELGTPGHGEILALQELSGHQVRFSYQLLLPATYTKKTLAGRGWWNGTPFTVTPGRTYHVVMTFDGRIEEITAIVNGVTELDLQSTLWTFPVVASKPVDIGATFSIPGVAPRYAGTLGRELVTTPVCTSLLQQR